MPAEFDEAGVGEGSPTGVAEEVSGEGDGAAVEAFVDFADDDGGGLGGAGAIGAVAEVEVEGLTG